jgi:hypothetical protein
MSRRHPSTSLPLRSGAFFCAVSQSLLVSSNSRNAIGRDWVVAGSRWRRERHLELEWGDGFEFVQK